MENAADITGLTDAQLIERVAVDVMNWRLTVNDSIDPAIVDEKYPVVFWYKPRPDISDERWLVALHNEEEAMRSWRPWNPLTDWNHTMEVYDEFWRRSSYADIEQMWTADYDPSSIQRAICLAALLAVRSSRPA